MGCVCDKSNKQVRPEPVQINVVESAPPQAERQTSVAKLKIPQKKRKIRETQKIVKTINENGVKMINDYVFDEFLGQGAFGKVKLAYNKSSGQKYAIKILRKSKLRRQREYVKDSKGNMVIKDALQDVKREIAIMKKLRHKNLIQLFEVIDNPKDDKLFMGKNTSYTKFWNMQKEGNQQNGMMMSAYFIKQMNPQPLMKHFLLKSLEIVLKDQIIVKINAPLVHKNGVVHRDLKPQNVLLTDTKVAKIADFGVSAMVGSKNDILDNTQGTYYFMPPEACDKDKVKDGYSGKAADIWALGITFYAFVYLDVPFTGSSIPDILNNIVHNEINFPQKSDISDGLKEFLQFILNKDAHLRPKIPEIAQHPWLNAGNMNLWDEINKEEQTEIELSQLDLDNAYSLSSIIMIKNWAFKWRTSSNLKKKSNIQQEVNSEQIIK